MFGFKFKRKTQFEKDWKIYLKTGYVSPLLKSEECGASIPSKYSDELIRELLIAKPILESEEKKLSNKRLFKRYLANAIKLLFKVKL